MSTTESTASLSLNIEPPEFPALAWRGLFGDYFKLVAALAPIPPAYHFANLLSMLSAEFGDTPCLREGVRVFGNLFIFCCGNSGSGKSQANRLMEENVVSVLGEAGARYHFILTSVSSAEGLIRTVGEKSPLRFYVDEIKELFKLAERPGNLLESTLNKAFVLIPLENNVKSKKHSLQVDSYFLTILFNGTPAHVHNDLSESMLKGGFIGRLLVFAGVTHNIIRNIGVPDAVGLAAFNDRLRELITAWRPFHTGARGAIIVTQTPESEALFRQWCDSTLGVALDQLHDIDVDLIQRMPLFAKKVAMIYCLAESTPAAEVAITAEQMAAAIAVAEFAYRSTRWVIEGWSGQKSGRQADAFNLERRLESILGDRGCMLIRDIQRIMHCSRPDIERAMQGMVRDGTAQISFTRPVTVHFKAKCACGEVQWSV